MESNLTREQNYALTLAIKGHNIYIGGQAGTGKTYVLTNIFKALNHLGKKVYCTCSTGIACSNLPTWVKATTIHSWAGIDDGRHDISYLRTLLLNHKKNIVDQVCCTDCLIIDEISMISAKIFEQVEEICAIKNDKLLFGGIQIIVSGDFYQLPPVRNLLYCDEGAFCFTSKVFSAIEHKIILNTVIRQTDINFINTVNEVSKGIISDKSMDMLSNLQKPLEDGEVVKLFSTNEQVDSYNRFKILAMPNAMYEYIGDDSGDKKYLQRILAPHALWIKIGCPVILLRNISETLVNGLRGTVEGISKDGPVVHFPGVNITIKMEKHTFSVYSPIQKKNVAQRIQYPLKLAFSMTVHKAQGMTIDRLEVDCQQMFAAGQLGVAIGRVRSPLGLRILNFKKEVCLPQPAIINDFLQIPSEAVLDDMTCCYKHRNHNQRESHSLPEPDKILGSTDDDFDEEEDIDHILINLKDTEFSTVEETFNIPEEFDINHALILLKYQSPLNSIQEQTNLAVDLLLKNIDVVKQFCIEEFSNVATLMSSLNINDTDPQPLMVDRLANFYKQCKDYMSTTEYRARIELMFIDILQKVEISQQVKPHISFNLVVAVRKFLMARKESLYDIDDRNVQLRTVDPGSYGKIRYVGGYCIASLRYHYRRIRSVNCYKTGPEEQLKYDAAVTKIDILDGISVHESVLELNTEYPESLIETAWRQKVTRGLTNISDKLFIFFLSLCRKCLDLLVDKNMNIHAESLYNHCKESIESDTHLYNEFVMCVKISSQTNFTSDENTVVQDLVNTVCAVEDLFKEITHKFLIVMLNQFMKDFLRSLSVQKKMAHIKEIKVSKKSLQGSPLTTISF